MYKVPDQTLAWIYRSFGSPSKVLVRQKIPVEPLTDDHVQLKLLGSPINPADLNMIQGSYPIRPDLSKGIAVGGNEGLLQVCQVGRSVRDLKPGDWVLPATQGLGLWRDYVTLMPNQLIKIPNSGSMVGAATVAVNPCTGTDFTADA